MRVNENLIDSNLKKYNTDTREAFKKILKFNFAIANPNFVSNPGLEGSKLELDALLNSSNLKEAKEKIVSKIKQADTENQHALIQGLSEPMINSKEIKSFM
jgi:hypothetical protein